MTIDHPRLSISRTISVIISIHSMKRSIEIGTVHCETIIAKLDNYKKSTFSPQKIRPLGPVHLDLISDKFDYLQGQVSISFSFFFIKKTFSITEKWNWELVRFFVIDFWFRPM